MRMGGTSSVPDNETAFFGRGLELDREFKEWWNEVRKSEEPPSPKVFLEKFGFPRRTTRNIFCRLLGSLATKDEGYDCSPGTIHYYATHFKHDFKDELEELWFNGECEGMTDDFVIDVLDSGLTPNGPTERDIKALLELCPPYRERHLQLCFVGNYSAEFIEFFLDNLDENHDISELSIELLDFERPDIRRAFDLGCMSVVQKFLPQLQSVKFKGEWTREAFSKCLEMMNQRKTPQRWTITVPDRLGADDPTGGNSRLVVECLIDIKSVINPQSYSYLLFPKGL
jgi:hypothetical protein